jgi:hypothetical protein
MVSSMKMFGTIGAFLLLAWAAAATTVDGHFQGWITEPGIEPPSYAVTEPIDSDINVDTVVLLCTESGARRFLELDLYLGTAGPLLPEGADPQALKVNPGVEISVDGEAFPARLLFADDYVVVADSPEDEIPSVSDGLLEALQHGQTMVVRFDLLAEPAGRPAEFDSQLVVDLESGRAAIAAVRRCASPGAVHQATR